jgi:hypothetical protein
MEIQNLIVAFILGILVIAAVGFIAFKGLYQVDADSTALVNDTLNQNLDFDEFPSDSQGKIYISPKPLLFKQHYIP